jgi:hypothetical protein
MKIKRKKIAVSEIIGVTLLLGMSIAMYSVVQFMVFSYPFSPSTPSVNLVGSVDGNKISIGHYSGESISIDAKIIIRVNSGQEPFIARNNITSNSINPDLWDIGEFVLINESDFNSVSDYKVGFFKDARIHVTVIDVETNSVVMMGYIQEGST